MRKALMGLVAVTALGLAAVGAPAPAQAHDGFGAGLAAGLLGGALVGGALASPGYGYGPGYYYAPRPVYGPAPAYVVEPGPYGDCFWQRQRFWDGYAWRIRNVRVCG
ncbi:hypothetical protein [Rhodopseudomonas palustris]|uniref:Uncharacterized protein n=1 Tax=Rhodopseudomonas palustris TaxID=1076 RepID=A0A418VGF2_RHOPL|nr:hypothetical protein [Rhodopseudomonas palustris]RJF75183.1 hypothetical protein D4Q52_10505 [Rhodopseudomonas palustris]